MSKVYTVLYTQIDNDDDLEVGLVGVYTDASSAEARRQAAIDIGVDNGADEEALNEVLFILECPLNEGVEEVEGGSDGS